MSQAYAKWIDKDKIELNLSEYKDVQLFKDGVKISSTLVNHVVNVEESHFDLKSEFVIKTKNDNITVFVDWKLIDRYYATDEPLGLHVVDEDYNLSFWSPSASEVNVVIFDKKHPSDQLLSIPMVESNNVWRLNNIQNLSKINDLSNYYYQFQITRHKKTIYALDPYAQSMAVWDLSLVNDQDRSKSSHVGKAAFVNISDSNEAFANIQNYKNQEDAIIYEVHVRDFTSHPSIDKDLEYPYGTFDAFIERLDYIETLGVTHIQLLPIMSYYNIDESKRSNRSLDPTEFGIGTNYNWGYDPHSYFSISGMYSKHNDNAQSRLDEFKRLVCEIHKRNMGVVLDVVFNHTARLHILEDLEPNYYHFMTRDGTAKTSFGGGRLATTHHMGRKLLKDSIKYWSETFKVDGFRFDMMGDHDAQTIQEAYDLAKSINPNVLMIGEGWITYVGDDEDPNVQAADQSWMKQSKSVGVYSDEYRNELKSGFENEGYPMFLTGAKRNIEKIFTNLTANPTNFESKHPQSVVNYIEAHDNLSLYDVIAMALKKDPTHSNEEILKRVRLGNFMLLTSQGAAFLQAGQEYGRTRRINADHITLEDEKQKKMFQEAVMVLKDKEGKTFKHPYVIHNAYNASDAINAFDWEKVSDTNSSHFKTMLYTKQLINLRRNTPAFHLNDNETIRRTVTLLNKDIEEDLFIAYTIKHEESVYIIFINADETSRKVSTSPTWSHIINQSIVIVDQKEVDEKGIINAVGIRRSDCIIIDPLTAIVLKYEEQ